MDCFKNHGFENEGFEVEVFLGVDCVGRSVAGGRNEEH